MNAQTISPRKVAVSTLAENGNDILAATSAMETKVNATPYLFKMLMRPLVRQACYDLLRSICRKERREIWTAPKLTAEGTQPTVKSLAIGTKNSLFNFPLPGGKRLGDALKCEVDEAATFYSLQANANAARARWLSAIAERMPASKTVSSVFTERRLADLQATAKMEAA